MTIYWSDYCVDVSCKLYFHLTLRASGTSRDPPPPRAGKYPVSTIFIVIRTNADWLK